MQAEIIWALIWVGPCGSSMITGKCRGDWGSDWGEEMWRRRFFSEEEDWLFGKHSLWILCVMSCFKWCSVFFVNLSPASEIIQLHDATFTALDFDPSSLLCFLSQFNWIRPGHCWSGRLCYGFSMVVVNNDISNYLRWVKKWKRQCLLYVDIWAPSTKTT